jgi:hypothetical protein
MQWGLASTTGSTIAPSIPDCLRLVHLLLDPERLQQVQDAAAAYVVSGAAWVRHARSSWKTSRQLACGGGWQPLP